MGRVLRALREGVEGRGGGRATWCREGEAEETGRKNHIHLRETYKPVIIRLYGRKREKSNDNGESLDEKKSRG